MYYVELYSDGSVLKNPNGPGGYGTILRAFDKDKKLVKTMEYTQGFESTTNNRMEMLGVIAGIEALTTKCEVLVTSDSKYVVNAFNENWIKGWLKRNWKTSDGKDVKNRDLWERMIEAIKPHKVSFKWIKGHNGHEFNERCDYLARQSARGIPLIKKDGKYYTKEEIKNMEEQNDLEKNNTDDK